MNLDNDNINKISYLRARDPSILQWNAAYAAGKKVKRNLQESFNNIDDRTVVIPEVVQEEDTHLKIYLRIKGGVPSENLYEINGNTIACHVPEGTYGLRNVKEGDKIHKKFTFTEIFQSGASQMEMFCSVVKPMALSFMNGRNSTLFTYGASGSGKTFTIVGTPEEPGLIPRALEYICRTIPDLKRIPAFKPLPNGDIEELNSQLWSIEEQLKMAILNVKIPDKHSHIKTYRQMQERLSSDGVATVESNSDVMVSMWVSFAEIYNENVYDLLTAIPKGQNRPKLKLGNNRGEIYIKDLSVVHTSDGMEAYQLLQYGLHSLNYAATRVNSHSSRSHCMFSLKLLQTSSVDDKVYLTNFNFCDLAGAERLKKTGNIGDRLKESNNINTSLMILGRCIENIRNNQKAKETKPIPFRESKLTQLFQKALLGHENISMIVNMSPAKNIFDETQHVLNFSAIAKAIAIEEQPVRVPKKKNRFSILMEKKAVPSKKVPQMIIESSDEGRQIEELQDTIQDLYMQIEELKIEHSRELNKELELAVDEYTQYHKETCEKLKIEMEAKMDTLKNYYEQKIQFMKQDVINLSGSSEDEQDVINLSSSSSADVSITPNECELESSNSVIPILELDKILKYQLKTLEDLLKDKEDLLKNAEDAFQEMKNENEIINKERLELREQNMLLLEKIQELEQMELLKATHSSDDS